MANEEHLAILRLEGAAWNQWRANHPREQPDLSWAELTRANLSRANLSKANLIGTKLSEADLSWTNLTGANLSEANLTGAKLSLADLTGANLNKVDLTEANLTYADLTYAKLVRAKLVRANLSEANLSEVDLNRAFLNEATFVHAKLAYTLFAAVDLSTVIGLDTVVHNAVSTIGIDTLYLSHGKIPEVFLRGCGVPAAVIKNLPLLLDTTQADAPTATITTLGQEEITHQQTLLANYRRTLASYIERLSILGIGHTAPELTHGVADARKKIARIKAILRTNGRHVADYPDDTDD